IAQAAISLEAARRRAEASSHCLPQVAPAHRPPATQAIAWSGQDDQLRQPCPASAPSFLARHGAGMAVPHVTSPLGHLALRALGRWLPVDRSGTTGARLVCERG